MYVFLNGQIPINTFTWKKTYRCFSDGEESEILDNCAQSYFHFFHSESHADTIAWSHSERYESVLVRFDVAFGIPSVKLLQLISLWYHNRLIAYKRKVTYQDWMCRALDNTLRRNEGQRKELWRSCPSWCGCHYKSHLYYTISQLC